MGSIQGSINSLIGSAGSAIKTSTRLSKPTVDAEGGAFGQMPGTVGSVQQQAAQRAKKSAADAIEARRTQRRNFMDYLDKQASGTTDQANKEGGNG